MERQPEQEPQPVIPRPLPEGVLTQLSSRGHLLLCLDYDGTLSDITPDPDQARPLPAARAALLKLARHRDKVTLAIVTGRQIEVVRNFLHINDALFAGIHGLSFVTRDGRQFDTPAANESLGDLGLVRDFLTRTVPTGCGFVVEDKKLALALHYRNAPQEQARQLVARFKQFVTEQTPRLQLMAGKMVLEALPARIGRKGDAVRFFIEELGEPRPVVAYFGDDATDEDAFRTVREFGGITVLVGAARPSFAAYRVDAPRDVAELLGELATRLKEPSVTQ